MELQQRPQLPCAAGASDAIDTTGVSCALNTCRKLLDAADAVIDQTCSANAEQMINANQQGGGQ